MSQYQSFFVSAGGNSSQCEELNQFLRSHIIIRTVENIVSTGSNCGIQILLEYKDSGVSNQQDKKNAKVDWKAKLANDEEREIFEKLREVRSKLEKENNLKAAYLVCKDEHFVAMIQNPAITEDEIKKLPNSSNILLKKFAHSLYEEYQKILQEMAAKKAEKDKSENTAEADTADDSKEVDGNEAGCFPF